MRKLAVLLLLATMALPALALKRVTVKQLEASVADLKGKPDPEAARLLANMELTERMTLQRLLILKEAMPGTESRRAATALADASSFLNLPPEDIPHAAPMDKDAQQQLLTLASTYVGKTLAKLPNFFATQAVTTYEDTPATSGPSNAYQPLRFARSIGATVYYRGGSEVMETRAGEAVQTDQTVTRDSGLLSSGEFGPVLNTVLSDAQSGKLKWSHWEPGTTSPVAVFSYAVPRGKSHYKVKVAPGGNTRSSETRPGYHGEVALDPATGTILRLTLRADLSEDDFMSRADLVVEYGSVEIGGQDYICPVRSIAIVRVPLEMQEVSLSAPTEGYAGLHDGSAHPVSGEVPAQTLLNDVAFEQYHLLRSESRIITKLE